MHELIVACEERTVEDKVRSAAFLDLRAGDHIATMDRPELHSG